DGQRGYAHVLSFPPSELPGYASVSRRATQARVRGRRTPQPRPSVPRCARNARGKEPHVKLRISQRSGEFFDLFLESARNLVAATELLKDLIEDYRDVEEKAQRIKDREHEGDEITHAIIRRLNTTFGNPTDREDIYALASA